MDYLKAAARGGVRGSTVGVLLFWPFIIAAKAGIGWMATGSALVVIAAGMLLAYQIKIYPFEEKRSNW